MFQELYFEERLRAYPKVLPFRKKEVVQFADIRPCKELLYPPKIVDLVSTICLAVHNENADLGLQYQSACMPFSR